MDGEKKICHVPRMNLYIYIIKMTVGMRLRVFTALEKKKMCVFFPHIKMLCVECIDYPQLVRRSTAKRTSEW
jgi:hypothetical protein